MQALSSDTCSFTIHAHCSHTRTHQNLSTTSLVFLFLPQLPPNCNFEPHNTKYVFIIPLRTQLMVCASWYVCGSMSLPGRCCHLFSRRHFGLQRSSPPVLLISPLWTRGSQCVASCSNTSTTYYSRVSGTNGSSVWDRVQCCTASLV